MLRGDLLSTLVQVWSRGLWCEGIQSEVVELLRENRDRQGCRLSFIDHQIQLSERIEALELRVALQRRQTLNRRADVAVFERLREGQSIFYERPGNRGPRSESLDTDYVTIAVSGSRD